MSVPSETPPTPCHSSIKCGGHINSADCYWNGNCPKLEATGELTAAEQVACQDILIEGQATKIADLQRELTRANEATAKQQLHIEENLNLRLVITELETINRVHEIGASLYEGRKNLLEASNREDAQERRAAYDQMEADYQAKLEKIDQMTKERDVFSKTANVMAEVIADIDAFTSEDSPTTMQWHLKSNFQDRINDARTKIQAILDGSSITEGIKPAF